MIPCRTAAHAAHTYQGCNRQRVLNSMPLRSLRRVTKFNGVHSIDLHFPEAFHGDQTEIHFIGFKGEFSEVGRGRVGGPAGWQQLGMQLPWGGWSEPRGAARLAGPPLVACCGRPCPPPPSCAALPGDLPHAAQAADGFLGAASAKRCALVRWWVIALPTPCWPCSGEGKQSRRCTSSGQSRATTKCQGPSTRHTMACNHVPGPWLSRRVPPPPPHTPPRASHALCGDGACDTPQPVLQKTPAGRGAACTCAGQGSQGMQGLLQAARSLVAARPLCPACGCASCWIAGASASAACLPATHPAPLVASSTWATAGPGGGAGSVIRSRCLARI